MWPLADGNVELSLGTSQHGGPGLAVLEPCDLTLHLFSSVPLPAPELNKLKKLSHEIRNPGKHRGEPAS